MRAKRQLNVQIDLIISLMFCVRDKKKVKCNMNQMRWREFQVSVLCHCHPRADHFRVPCT